MLAIIGIFKNLRHVARKIAIDHERFPALVNLSSHFAANECQMFNFGRGFLSFSRGIIEARQRAKIQAHGSLRSKLAVFLPAGDLFVERSERPTLTMYFIRRKVD